MKKLLITILTLSSLNTFADEVKCRLAGNIQGDKYETQVSDAANKMANGRSIKNLVVTKHTQSGYDQNTVLVCVVL